MPIDSTDTPAPPPPLPAPDNSRQRPATENELASAPLSELGREWRKEIASNAAEIVSIARDLAPPGVLHDLARAGQDAAPAVGYIAGQTIAHIDKGADAVMEAVDKAAEAVADNLDDLASDNRGSAQATMDGMGRPDQDADLKLFFKELETQNRAVDGANRRELYGPDK